MVQPELAQAQRAPSPLIILDTLMSYHRSEALRAAIELDLFRFIGKGPGDVASLAQGCAASERGIRILCDFLTIQGLLVKNDGRYRHSPTSALYLDPASPACLSAIAPVVCGPFSMRCFANLADTIRRGRTADDGITAPESPMWVGFAQAMTPMLAPLAWILAAMILEDRTGPMRVLDIAAGNGMFGIAVAKQAPEAHIVAVDWPKVLEIAASNAKTAGLADRFESVAGSVFTVDLGGPYDIALVTNFVHLFDRVTGVQLFKKVHSAMNPGGRVAILDLVPNEDRISPAFPAAFSLAVLGTTPSGDAYTFSELEGMLHDAGFSEITLRPIPGGPHTVVLGCV